MRKRFRGNKPISTSTELEAGGGQEEGGRGQLYAGGSGFGEGVRRTDGKEGKEGEEWEKFVRNDGIEDWRRKK